MPHKCIGCGKIFEKNDEAILDGCPACGSNRFLFIREGEKLPEAEIDLDLVKEEQKPEKLDEIIDRIEEGMDDDLRLESVRIIEPGSYEVNIESLLERDEIILALKGDGSYVIHLPSMFARLKGGRKHK
jgi:hypothetical protein